MAVTWVSESGDDEDAMWRMDNALIESCRRSGDARLEREAVGAGRRCANILRDMDRWTEQVTAPSVERSISRWTHVSASDEHHMWPNAGEFPEPSMLGTRIDARQLV
jgi:hypothetical protein